VLEKKKSQKKWDCLKMNNDIKKIIKVSQNLVIEIAKIGRKNGNSSFLVDNIFPFRYYFNNKYVLDLAKLDEIDGLWTRREIFARFLLVSSVLNQGPDIEGLNLLFKNTINSLYEKEVRIFHKPLDFFKEIGVSIDEILENHKKIKNIRAKDWAKENKTIPSKYNLFTDKTKQVLGYAVYRWGVPLCFFYLLEKDNQKKNKQSKEPFVEYIESWPSAEIMSQMIKDHERYGLGKAVGDKAGHLFAKFYIHAFKLTKRNDISFGPLSYELPFDSNAGRVLFRTGFLLSCANLSDYEKWDVIQKGKGKGGRNYIRVTNIRGKRSKIFSNSPVIMSDYAKISIDHLKTKKRNPSEIEIQQIPNVLLLNSGYGIGDLDDGLIYIGTNYCYNHEQPLCNKCPIKNLCLGYKQRKDLISNYRT
jgi:hypothetical protein